MKLLTNVVAPALKEELKESLIDKKFSVVVDESTDVAANKHMANILCYFDDASSEIFTAFVGLVPVISTWGESLLVALKDCLAGLALDLANCFGYGSACASIMIVNWEELKVYFIVAESQCNQNARFKARMIQEMLADLANYLYIHFVTPVVSQFERVNAFFQAINADPEFLTTWVIACPMNK
eukprot:gene5711-10962_t